MRNSSILPLALRPRSRRSELFLVWKIKTRVDLIIRISLCLGMSDWVTEWRCVSNWTLAWGVSWIAGNPFSRQVFPFPFWCSPTYIHNNRIFVFIPSHRQYIYYTSSGTAYLEPSSQSWFMPSHGHIHTHTIEQRKRWRRNPSFFPSNSLHRSRRKYIPTTRRVKRFQGVENVVRVGLFFFCRAELSSDLSSVKNLTPLRQVREEIVREPTLSVLSLPSCISCNT